MDETSVSGSAVFVDFENRYAVDFEIVCEGSATVSVDAGTGDGGSGNDGEGQGGGFPLVGAVSGSFTTDGELFDNVDVYGCEPFSSDSEGPDPNDLKVLGLTGPSAGLEIEVSHGQGVDMSDGTQFDQISFNAFYSRQGAAGLEQFEGSARSDSHGGWVSYDQETAEEVEMVVPPLVMEGNRITGSLAGLEQTWPDEGAATVDITYDFGLPSEMNEEC